MVVCEDFHLNMIQVPLSAGSFVLDRYFFDIRATAADVRKSLSNIRMMRVILECTQV